jgi:integrase
MGNLRHSHASRLMSGGVSSLFIAQMLGHSSASIVGTYAKATDEYKRDAIRKLESLRPTRQDASSQRSTSRPN